MPEDLVPQPELAQLFAELAPKFGLSRAAGQCFALIWRAAQAPSADDLVRKLGLSRSNVSVALKELRETGLARAARSPGSRRDYFVSEPDPWAIVHLLLAERWRRDIAPAAERLRMLEHPSADPRIAPLAQAMTETADWMGRLAGESPESLARIFSEPAGGKKKKKKRLKDQGSN